MQTTWNFNRLDDVFEGTFGNCSRFYCATAINAWVVLKILSYNL